MENLLVEIGNRWQRGTCDVHTEHFATHAMQEALFSCKAMLPLPPSKPRCLLASVEGEDHALSPSTRLGINEVERYDKKKEVEMIKSKYVQLVALCVSLVFFLSSPAFAEDRTALDNDVHAAIKLLKETSPLAKALAPNAKGALVFPNIVKAGFLVGVQYGNGALVRAKQGGGYYIASYYNITSGSYGLQAGVQSFGYVMALMTDAAVEHVETSQGWELGVGPSIVVVDEGIAKTLTTETAKSDVYAFTFGQKGLMAGLGLQGTKITRLNK